MGLLRSSLKTKDGSSWILYVLKDNLVLHGYKEELSSSWTTKDNLVFHEYIKHNITWFSMDYKAIGNQTMLSVTSLSMVSARNILLLSASQVLPRM